MPNSSEPVYVLVGARIRLIREALDISQQEMSKRLKMTRTSVCNIEQGRQRIQLHGLTKIARALGTSEKHLLRGIWL